MARRGTRAARVVVSYRIVQVLAFSRGTLDETRQPRLLRVPGAIQYRAPTVIRTRAMNDRHEIFYRRTRNSGVDILKLVQNAPILRRELQPGPDFFFEIQPGPDFLFDIQPGPDFLLLIR